MTKKANSINIVGERITGLSTAYIASKQGCDVSVFEAIPNFGGLLATFEVGDNRFVRGLKAYAGFKQIDVEYDRAERAAGEIKYTFKKLVQLALNGLFDFLS